MKKLPDEKTLDELLDLAKDSEQQALALYEKATEIDDKWRTRLESKRKVATRRSIVTANRFAMNTTKGMAVQVLLSIHLEVADFTRIAIFVNPNLMLARAKVLEPLNTTSTGNLTMTTMPRR